MKSTQNPRLQLCVERYRTDILNSLPAVSTAMWLGPSARARRRAKNLYQELTREFGRPRLPGHLKNAATIGMALWTEATLRMGLFQHPQLVRTEYRT